ncbi:sorting nexin-5-like isoform X1 [Branchiostoma lanceolatum]|uniref:sorting nexin-5-like isoform X1 n=1 Tax=Branchiostoma lanceolatum TaxID=7740 RepID=UPI003456DC25
MRSVVLYRSVIAQEGEDQDVTSRLTSSKMDNATDETNTNGTADVSDSPEADQDTPESSGLPEPTLPPKPFEPVFTVKVTDAAKDGEVVKYSLKTAKIKSESEEYKVVRQYEDFEWLEHCLITQNDIGGIIVPPLPPKPSTTAQSAEARSKKQLGNKKRHGSDDEEGNDIKLVVGDEFEKDCRSLEKYLQLVVTHPILGQDESITKFLTVREAPTRAKLKKSIFSNLSKSLGEARKGGHKMVPKNMPDVNEFFQKERDTVNEVSLQMKEAKENYMKIVYGEQRVAVGLSHLSTALHLGGQLQEGADVVVNKLFTQFSEGLEDAKQGLEVMAVNDENTLGFSLDLYSRYLEAEKEMLYRRTCKMMEFEAATKAVEKAKPQKRQMAEAARDKAEKEFEDISKAAEKELKNFHHQRVLTFQDSLVRHADAKIKAARDTYALLTKCVTALKTLDTNFKPL